MNIYIIADTHFNHTEPMITLCGRPGNFNELFWKNLKIIGPGDILIHLGDICLGRDEEVHNRIREYGFRKILVKGNHDQKSNSWYLKHGWDFVCEEFKDTLFGKNILFSHVPRAWDGIYDLNIHGHFHNTDHRRFEQEFLKIQNERQKLYSPENEKYLPVQLEKFIKSKS